LAKKLIHRKKKSQHANNILEYKVQRSHLSKVDYVVFCY